MYQHGMPEIHLRHLAEQTARILEHRRPAEPRRSLPRLRRPQRPSSPE